MADLSKLSDQDLIAAKEGRLQDISDAGLMILGGKEPEKKTGGIGRSLLAGVEGFNTGIENRIRGLGQAGLSALDAVLPGENFRSTQEKLQKGTALANLQLEQNFPENPVARGVGKFVGDIAALAPASALMPGGFVAQSAIGGGLEGLTRPSETEQSIVSRGVQSGVGAAIGAVGGKLLQSGGKLVIKQGEKLGKILGFADDNISDIFTNLDQYGVEQNIANEKVGKILGKEAKNQAARISNLYGRAKQAGENIIVNNNDVLKLSDDLTDMVEKTHLPDDRAALKSLQSRLVKFSEQNKPITINDLESVRSEASATSKAGVRSAMEVAKKIDDFIINQDKTTGTLWKKAIASRRQFAKKFEDPKAIADILNSETTDVISNRIWGAAAGAQPKSGAIYRDTLNALPLRQRKEAGFVLRQSLVNKIIQDASANVKSGDEIAGDQIIRAIKLIKTKRPDLWKVFPQEEQKMINGLVSELQQKGDSTTKVGNFLFRTANRIVNKNIELPSPIKPKPVYSLEDVISMARTKPSITGKFTPFIAGASGESLTKNINFE